MNQKHRLQSEGRELQLSADNTSDILELYNHKLQSCDSITDKLNYVYYQMNAPIEQQEAASAEQNNPKPEDSLWGNFGG